MIRNCPVKHCFFRFQSNIRINALRWSGAKGRVEPAIPTGVTVAAMVTLRPGYAPPQRFPTRGYLAIATERTFADYWLPVASIAGLRWVPRFATGLTLTPKEIGPLIEELNVLGACLQEAADHVAADVRDRLARLLDLLASLDPNSIDDLFIG
jgi:hypothetical protein